MVPVLTAGKTFILGYTDEENVYREKESIIFDDFTLDLKYINFPYKIKSSAIKILTSLEDNLFFIYNSIIIKKLIPNGHNRHYISYVQNLPISIPSLLEQQKIAHFFSLLDKQIKLWERKLELYELKKKYFLNRLLHEKNNLLKLRFKGFDGDWKILLLKDMCIKMKFGGTPKTDNHNFYNGHIPFLSISDFSSKYLYKTSKFINNLALNNSSSYIVEKNNIILSIYATIGKPIINKIDVAIPQSVLGIFLKEKNDKEFIYYVLLKKEKWFIKMAETGSQSNLSLQTLQKIPIYFPNLLEQKKISKFLTLIDKQINDFSFIKEKIIIIKKFYINKLFL